VAGVPDAYRGETVKAYVILKPGAEATREELVGLFEHLENELDAGGFFFPPAGNVFDPA
jgi:acyl-coenzyme A synthetase/AMP-(fatty) acid ligase